LPEATEQPPDAAAIATEIERRVPPLSRRVIEEMYQNPFWRERFGESGRQRAGEDGDFHVRYLAEAVRAGSPAVMVTYARWLRSLLVARGMCSRHLADNFARLAAAVAADETLPGRTLAVDLLIDAETALLYEEGEPRALQDHAPQLAAEAVERLRARHPDWYTNQRGGWSRCVDDVLYHLSYLADALAAGRADLLAGYLKFIAGFLTKVGVPVAHLEETLETLEATLVERGALLAASIELLRTGRAALTA